MRASIDLVRLHETKGGQEHGRWGQWYLGIAQGAENQVQEQQEDAQGVQEVGSNGKDRENQIVGRVAISRKDARMANAAFATLGFPLLVIDAFRTDRGSEFANPTSMTCWMHSIFEGPSPARATCTRAPTGS